MRILNIRKLFANACSVQRFRIQLGNNGGILVQVMGHAGVDLPCFFSRRIVQEASNSLLSVTFLKLLKHKEIDMKGAANDNPLALMLRVFNPVWC